LKKLFLDLTIKFTSGNYWNGIMLPFTFSFILRTLSSVADNMFICPNYICRDHQMSRNCDAYSHPLYMIFSYTHIITRFFELVIELIIAALNDTKRFYKNVAAKVNNEKLVKNDAIRYCTN